MQSSREKDYPLESNLSEADLDENHSFTKMLRLVGENKRVIDFGCSTGTFAQLLTKKGCHVTGVEVNPQAAKVAEQYCEQVIIADLDFVSLAEIVQDQTFDVAVFGDVLEHLRDPWKVLKQTRQLLKPEGYVVASIPNIAHGAIRLALLRGSFEYSEMGILDNTHLRFFTRKTVEELFELSGFCVDVIERTKLPMYSASNLIPHIDRNNFDIKVIEEIEQDENAETLQFVLKTFPVSLEGKYAALNQKYSRLVEEVQSSQTQLQLLGVELEQTEIQRQEKTTQLERSHSQLQQTQAQLERSHSLIQQQQAQLEQSHSQIQQQQAQLEQSQAQLQQTQAQLQAAQAVIADMQQSKFWKLRTAWFNLKKIME
jgi:O-antigen biosynthesis protein